MTHPTSTPEREPAPCPFCGDKPAKRDTTFWTGMRSDVIRVDYQHHCNGLDARQRGYITMSGVTEPEALAAWNRRAALASSPAVPSLTGQYFDAYLCRAWGETELPAVELVRDLEGVRAFMIREWLGNEYTKDGSGAPILPGVMEEIGQQDWRDEPEWSMAFEIGGVSVERVTGYALAAPQTEPGAIRRALQMAVRQNSHDMLMTGEEIRQCEAALKTEPGAAS